MTRRQDTASLADLDTDGFEFDARDVNEGFFYGIPRAVIQRAEEHLLDPSIRSVAYFSMEFGLAPSVYQPYLGKAALSPRNRKRDFEIFSNMRQMDYYHVVHIDTVVDI